MLFRSARFAGSSGAPPPCPRAPRGLQLLPRPGCSPTVRWAALRAHLSGILRAAARGSVFLPGEAQSRPGPRSVTEAPSPALLGGGAEGGATLGQGERNRDSAPSAARSVPGWSVGRGEGGSPGASLELELQAVPARQPGCLGSCPSPGPSRKLCPGPALPRPPWSARPSSRRYWAVCCFRVAPSRLDRKSTRLNSSHRIASRMPSSA